MIRVGSVPTRQAHVAHQLDSSPARDGGKGLGTRGRGQPVPRCQCHEPMLPAAASQQPIGRRHFPTTRPAHSGAANPSSHGHGARDKVPESHRQARPTPEPALSAPSHGLTWGHSASGQVTGPGTHGHQRGGAALRNVNEASGAPTTRNPPPAPRSLDLRREASPEPGEKTSTTC